MQPQPRERWQTTVVVAGRRELRRPARSRRIRTRDRIDHDHAHRRRRCRRAAARAGRRSRRRTTRRHRCTFTTSSSIRNRRASGRSADVRRTSPWPRRPDSTVPVVVRMHPGAKAEHASRFSTFGWQRDAYDLVPGQAVEVELPRFAERRRAVDDQRRNRLLSDVTSIPSRRSPVPRRLGRSQSGTGRHTMTTLADLRRDYASRALDENDAHPDPIQQFTTWFDEALKSQLLDVNAMTLATASATGEPSARTVLLKGVGRTRIRLLHQLRQRERARPRREPARVAAVLLARARAAGADHRSGDEDDAG